MVESLARKAELFLRALEVVFNWRKKMAVVFVPTFLPSSDDDGTTGDDESSIISAAFELAHFFSVRRLKNSAIRPG